jgi:hypothetical protein
MLAACWCRRTLETNAAFQPTKERNHDGDLRPYSAEMCLAIHFSA